MDDRDFFDHLLQLWAKTYGAEKMYWMPVQAKIGQDEYWEVYAVDEDNEQHFIASFQSDEDADFIAAVHGCLPDLVRRLHTALDEADRADYGRDSREGRIAELELEVKSLRNTLDRLSWDPPWSSD
jgi:hypothetical protein